MKARALLEQMASGIEGLLAVSLVGMDGVTTDLVTLDIGFPAEAVNQDVVTAAKLFLYICRKGGGATLDHYLMSCDKFSVLVAVAGGEHCVAVFLGPKGNLGRARMELRRYLPKIAGLMEGAAV